MVFCFLYICGEKKKCNCYKIVKNLFLETVICSIITTHYAAQHLEYADWLWVT